MLRPVMGVIAGYVTWSVLWLLGNRLFFGEAAEVVAGGEPYTETGPLLGLLVLSVVCSLAAGVVAAKIPVTRVGGTVVIMAILLLVTGIVVQVAAWPVMPVWYHVMFLALIVPVCLTGAWLVTGAGRQAV